MSRVASNDRLHSVDFLTMAQGPNYGVVRGPNCSIM